MKAETFSITADTMIKKLKKFINRYTKDIEKAKKMAENSFIE